MRLTLWRIAFFLAGAVSLFLAALTFLFIWLTKRAHQARDRAEIELLYAHPFAQRRRRAQRDGVTR